MAKLSERVQEQQARRTRRPLPPSHPRESLGEPGVSGRSDPATAQVIDLTPTASSAYDAQGEPAPAIEEGSDQPEQSQVPVAAPVPSNAVRSAVEASKAYGCWTVVMDPVVAQREWC